MIQTDGQPTIAWANPPEDDEHHERATSSCPVINLARTPGIKAVKLSREVAAAMSPDELKRWLDRIPPHVEVQILRAVEEVAA